MNNIALIVIPIILAVGCGCVVAYQVFQLVDFVVGIVILVCIAAFILYEFINPMSMLHQAVPELPTRYRLP